MHVSRFSLALKILVLFISSTVCPFTCNFVAYNVATCIIFFIQRPVLFLVRQSEWLFSGYMLYCRAQWCVYISYNIQVHVRLSHVDWKFKHTQVYNIRHASAKKRPEFVFKESKNISIKMLKDVGMTVPKSRETSAVYTRVYYYMQQHRGWYVQQDRGWGHATIITCVCGAVDVIVM